MNTFFHKYKFLLLGALLMCFYNGRHTILIASYLGPVFLMIFYRKENTIKSILLSFLFFSLTTLYSFSGVPGYNGYMDYVIIISFSIVLFLPFVIDFFLSRKFKHILNTLILPLAGVTVEYLFSLVSPFGTWGSIAYSQYNNLPLCQLASVTGIFGISFIVLWTCSFINYLIENRFDINIIKKVSCIFITIVISIYFLGGLRLAYSDISSTPTVKISSISVFHHDLYNDIHNLVKGTDTDIDAFKNKLDALHNQLFTLTKREAENGSKIILWHESDGLVLDDDYNELIKEGRKIAEDYNIYLLMTPTPLNLKENTEKNQTVLIDNNGNISYEYNKYHIVPGDNDIQGNGQIQYADTPYGRIGSIICFDGDFPPYVRQAGKDDIDILLMPSSDWKAIDPIHTQLCSFRGIENGCSTLRQVQTGFSLSADYLGRTISSMDYFNTDDKVMVSHVPIKGTKTIYSYIGDAFSWICILSLFSILYMRISKRIRP